MKRTKKILALVLAGAMVLGLSACGSNSAGPDSSASNESSSGEAKDKIVIAMHAGASDFSPNGSMGEPDRIVAMNIYERLCYYEGDTLQYRLATNIEQADETHIDITLRDDVYDTEGNHFTASDLVYSLQYCGQTPQFASLVAHVDFENTEIVDDYHVILAMKDAYTMQIELFSSIDIFDEDAMKASEDGMILTPVGYGPYKLTGYTSGTEVVISANEDFYLGAPEIKEVTFNVVAEASQRTNALVSGDIDVAYSVQTNDVDYINETEGIECQEFSSIIMAGIVMNENEASPLNDSKVRKAIAYAINKEAIAETYYKGHASVATDTCSAEASSDYSSGWDDVAAKYDNYYEHNPEKAKQLLAEAGYADGLTIQGILSMDAEMAAMVQSMLAEVGITLVNTQYDEASCIAIANNEKDKWDIWFNRWLASSGNSLDLMNMHMVMLNGCDWKDASHDEFANTINTALVTMDEAARQELTVKAHDMATDNLGLYSFVCVNSIWGVKEGIDVKFSYEPGCLPDFYLWSWK